MSKIANVALFNAVYETVYKKTEAGNVPQSYLPAGAILERAVDIKYVTLAPNHLVNRSSAEAAVTVRDANRDANRFSGISPNPAVKSQGGLYLFRHEEAGLAEMMHYSENGGARLPVSVGTRRVSVPHLMATKAIFKTYLTRPFMLANLSSYSTGGGEVGRFFNDIASEPGVKNLLGGAPLQSKMLDAGDYSVSRAFGLAFGSSRFLNGLEAQTARQTERVYQTGNNICLFGDQGTPVSGLKVDSVLLNFSSAVLFDQDGNQIKLGSNEEAVINGFIPNATQTEYSLVIEVDDGLKQGMKIESR